MYSGEMPMDLEEDDDGNRDNNNFKYNNNYTNNNGFINMIKINDICNRYEEIKTDKVERKSVTKKIKWKCNVGSCNDWIDSNGNLIVQK